MNTHFNYEAFVAGFNKIAEDMAKMSVFGGVSMSAPTANTSPNPSVNTASTAPTATPSITPPAAPSVTPAATTPKPAITPPALPMRFSTPFNSQSPMRSIGNRGMPGSLGGGAYSRMFSAPGGRGPAPNNQSGQFNHPWLYRGGQDNRMVSGNTPYTWAHNNLPVQFGNPYSYGNKPLPMGVPMMTANGPGTQTARGFQMWNGNLTNPNFANGPGNEYKFSPKEQAQLKADREALAQKLNTPRPSPAVNNLNRPSPAATQAAQPSMASERAPMFMPPKGRPMTPLEGRINTGERVLGIMNAERQTDDLARRAGYKVGPNPLLTKAPQEPRMSDNELMRGIMAQSGGRSHISGQPATAAAQPVAVTPRTTVMH